MFLASKRWQLTRVPMLLVCLGGGLTGALWAQQAAPQLLFTDIESGPGVGGEGALGAFITIYGEGFGATQGSSTVTIGGQPVARVFSWEQDAAARGLDRVVVQPGPAAVSGDIVVTVAGQASNGLPFTVRTGSVYFVNQATGNDANAGTHAQPWASIWRPRTTLAAGDIVYVEGGTFSELDPATPGWDTVLFLAGRFGSQLLMGRVSEARLNEATRWLERRGSVVVLISRFTPGLRLGPFGTAQLFSTPSSSRRKS